MAEIDRLKEELTQFYEDLKEVQLKKSLSTSLEKRRTKEKQLIARIKRYEDAIARYQN